MYSNIYKYTYLPPLPTHICVHNPTSQLGEAHTIMAPRTHTHTLTHRRWAVEKL